MAGSGPVVEDAGLEEVLRVTSKEAKELFVFENEEFLQTLIKKWLEMLRKIWQVSS